MGNDADKLASKLMKKLFLFLALLMCAGTALAQTDPLNVAYLPSIDTTCSHYPSNVWVGDSLQTIYQDVGTAPTCVNGATFGAWGTIYATQNEWADFQVFIHDTGSGTTGYQVTVSSFVKSTGPSGSFTIAAPDSTHTDIIPYAEQYVNVAVPSGIPKTGTATYLNVLLSSGAGHIPDPLVPAIDPYFHQTTNAFPVNVSANNNQGAWVDIRVPTTAPSGYYLGSVTLQSGCTGPYPSTGCATVATVPIILAVWQWPSAGFMPSTSSLWGVNGIGDLTACDGFFGGTGFPGSACANGWPAPGGNINTALTLLKEQSTVLYLDHRIQQSSPYVVGPPWTNFDQYFKPLLNGTTVSGTGVANTILPGAAIVNMQWNGDGGTFQDWMTHFQSNGWGNKLDNYYCDEPPNGCAGGVAGWLQVWQRAGTLHALTPSMALQTTTSFSRLASGNGSGQSEATMCTGGFNGAVAAQSATCLDNSIDWMVPNVIDYANGQYANLSAYTTWVSGSSNIGTAPPAPHRRYGSYWACDSTACGSQYTAPGSYYIENVQMNLDTTAISHRATAWFMGFTGATGDLYFANDQCWAGSGATCTYGHISGSPLACDNSVGHNNGDPFAGVGYNCSQGDGTLVYPGRTSTNPTGFGNVGVTTPIFLPSMRLKHWRDGHQDYEYFVVLRANGKSSAVSSAFSSFMNVTPGATGVLAWSFNNTEAPAGSFTSDLPDARATLGNTMHALTFTPQLNQPFFSPGAGTYSSPQTVSITDTDPSATICWTSNGSTPTSDGAGTCINGTTYTTPVSVSASLTLQAIASRSGFTDSSVASAVYFINTFPWSGILDPTRAIDWSQAGVVNGIPSATWAQCGLPIAAYAGTAAAINTQITGCGNNQYVLLGPGTFTLSTGITLNGRSNVVVRGSGPDQTFINETGFDACGGNNAGICLEGQNFSAISNTATLSAQPGGTNAADWTAGFSSGTTSITLANVGSNGITNGMYINLDQADDPMATAGFINCTNDITLNNGCVAESPSGDGRTVPKGWPGRVGTGDLVGTTFTQCGANCGSTFPTDGSYAPACPTTGGLMTGILFNYVSGGAGTAYPVTISCITSTTQLTLASAPSAGNGRYVFTFLAGTGTLSGTNFTSTTGQTFTTSGTSGSGTQVGQAIALMNSATNTVYQVKIASVTDGQHIVLASSPTPPANGTYSYWSLYHGQIQMVQVVSGCSSPCTGAGPFSITITPGLYAHNWSGSRGPGAWWPTTQVTNAGVENLSIDMTNSGAGHAGSIVFFNTNNTWVKNVRSIGGHRNDIWCYGCVHVTVESNYFVNSQNAATQSYSVESYRASDNLIVNNIMQHKTGPIVMGISQGSVFANNYGYDNFAVNSSISGQITITGTSQSGTTQTYTYTGNSIVSCNNSCPISIAGTTNGGGVFNHTNVQYQSATTSSFTVTVAASAAIGSASESGAGLVSQLTLFQTVTPHDPGDMYNLYEGNIGTGTYMDIFHGPALANTYFRNLFTGNEKNKANFSRNPVRLDPFNRYNNIIGNILGTSVQTVYQTSPGSTSGTPIYAFSPFAVTENASAAFTFHPYVAADTNVLPTSMRWGNCDPISSPSCRFVSSEVPSGLSDGYANPVPGSTTLPPSFYRASPPAYFTNPFATVPFPFVGPDVPGGAAIVPDLFDTNTALGGHGYSNSAELCWENTPIDSSYPLAMDGGIRLFNANNCYATSVPTVVTPTFSPGGGIYSSVQTVTISTTTPSAVICYTTNGSTPAATTPGTCSNGTTYSGPVTVSASETINAIGTLVAFTNSPVGTANYTINAGLPTPTITPGSGIYVNSVSVSLTDSQPTATICYTTDGSTPAATTPGTCSNGTAYTVPIVVSTTGTVIKAIATQAGFTNSSQSSATYTIVPTNPVIIAPHMSVIIQ
jgi:Fn3 associated/Domain of unknown function (DUF4091)/Chitobiase/beta-hexosaminidase C-terminal domain